MIPGNRWKDVHDTPRRGWQHKVIEVLKMSRRLGIELVRTTTDGNSVFEVLADGEVVLCTRVEAAAIAIYDEIFDERDQPFAELRSKERATAEANSLYAERVARTKDRAHGRGGRGGRGGV